MIELTYMQAFLLCAMLLFCGGAAMALYLKNAIENAHDALVESVDTLERVRKNLKLEE